MKHNYWCKIFCFTIFMYFVFVPLCFCEVVFRFDDYPAQRSELLKLQEKIIILFKEKNIPLTIAVMPSQLKDIPSAVEFLRSNSGASLEIALHGWDHTDLVKGKYYNNASEFAGVSYDEQLNRIEKGVNLFESILSLEPETFVPPFNTYDRNTVMVLNKMGFKTISASFTKENMEYGDLNIIPQTCLLKDINSIKKLDNKLYVVMFHVYDIMESKSNRAYFTYNELNSLLDNLKKQKELGFNTISELAKQKKEVYYGERINSVVPILGYRGSPFFYFPAHWMMQLPKYYGTVDYYEYLIIRTKIKGVIFDLIMFSLLVSFVLFAKRVIGLCDKNFSRYISNIMGIILVLIIIFLVIYGIVKVKQGKSNFAYKYRIPLTLSTLLFGEILLQNIKNKKR